MKLFLIVILIALAAFSLVACGTGGEDVAPSEIVSTPIPESPPAPTPETEQDSVETEAGFTIYHALNDLDYMMWVLENNFPFWSVAYWARGVDIPLLADNARRAIKDAEKLDEDIFLDLMAENFETLMGIGHFSIIIPLHYHMIRIGASGGFISNTGFFELLNSRPVQDFYSTRVIDYEEITLEVLVAESPQPIIKTMEEESIAIITIPQFAYIGEDAENEIIELYSRLNDFRHLIIDIRGNPGGNLNLLGIIMGLHSDIASTATEMFVFFKDGEYITRFTAGSLVSGVFPGQAAGRYVFGSVDELLEKNDFTQLVPDDIERFTYAFPATVRITAPIGAERVDFDGSVWMLVDERVGSAAQITAWLAKDMDFATIVGEITGGAYGGFRTYSAMPNTGILFIFDAFYITDRHGRPLEAGTIPHHFNHPGMDAMETVLALIAEGEY